VDPVVFSNREPRRCRRGLAARRRGRRHALVRRGVLRGVRRGKVQIPRLAALARDDRGLAALARMTVGLTVRRRLGIAMLAVSAGCATAGVGAAPPAGPIRGWVPRWSARGSWCRRA
jgi:hypothetical protein